MSSGLERGREMFRAKAARESTPAAEDVRDPLKGRFTIPPRPAAEVRADEYRAWLRRDAARRAEGGRS